MDQIYLSIYVATYNHERYIARALDSILMQQTQYSYEVLIGEDCSQDSTREILKKYEKKYPGKFKIFYRERNMHGLEINNAEDLKRRCVGKYMIALEGDDYWIDPLKIEKQINFLEKHQEYIAVAHNCLVVDENSKPNGEIYPECKDEEYLLKHFEKDILPGQLTTVMYRNFYYSDEIDTSLCKSKLTPGDRCLYFSLISNGKIFCMQEKMSAYRHVVKGGSSFSANYIFNYENQKKLTMNYLQYAQRINNREAEKTAEFVHVRDIYSCYRNGYINMSTAVQDMKIVRHQFRSLAKLFIMLLYNKINMINKRNKCVC